MSRSLCTPRSAVAATVLALTLPATAAHAGVPKVVADIPPVHGLVARVMAGVGEPSLLIRPGASPHGYAMKPSEASALQSAQVVFFVGPELTPWLMRPIETLAPKAAHVELLDAPGSVMLPTRTGATFEPHDHGDHDHGDHDHEGHDHGPEGDAAHGPDDGHDHAHDGHSHDGIDPHAWLDPENGKAWTRAIAAELAKIDPDNAAAYAANADAAVAEIDAAEAETKSALAPISNLRFVAFHDAYQYFENRFGVHAAGAVSLSDATTPSPARIAELRKRVAEMGVTCALSEPQFDPDLLNTVFDGSGVKTAVIDPIGAEIPTGQGFYPALIRKLGAALTACR